jgi:signal transduction histidine kinase
MGDIVWSLRTGADSLEALAIFLSERGRRLFPEGGALLRTRFPASWPEARLSLAARYNLAMIGLEAMHNAAKHSGASEVILDLRPEEGRWRLSVADNGSGLKAAGPETEEMEPGEREGLGFASMRRRAEEIGAGFRVEPGAGQGTTITVLFDPDAQAKPRLI